MILLLLLCFSLSLSAQYTSIDAPLYKNGNLLRNAWAGGMNLPQFSPVDLNNDGIKDLVVFDREGAVATPYLNHGTPNQVDYHFAPEYMKHLPNMDALNFMLFRDYNGDGIEDIFGMHLTWGQGAAVAVWKGRYINDTIHYEIVKEQLKYDAPGAPLPYVMFVYNSDLPSVDDVDGDGDLDLLAFTLDWSFSQNVFWYKNTSVEDGHGTDSLHYILESACWGLFQETGVNSIVNFGPLADSCYMNPYFNPKFAVPPHNSTSNNNSRNGRHVGANVTTIDINGDSIKEMFLGAVSYNNVNMLSGTEINDTVLITNQDVFFPSYDTPVDIFTFPATFFMDVDNDTKTDMIATPSEMMVGQAVLDSVAWWYRNTTGNNNMAFDFQQKDFLVGEMLDIGYRAFPTVFDHNGDGLMDILLGTYGSPKIGGGFKFGMTLLENIGTSTAPEFEWITSSYANLDTLFILAMHPTTGDLDGDGDIDMMLGGQDGRLTFVENLAGPGALAVWQKPVLNYKNIDVDDFSAPCLVDLDRDGDLDLIVGNFAGDIQYYENIGSASIPGFVSVPTYTGIGGYNLQNAYSQAAMPYIYDNNGSYEMFIGHAAGNILHLNNIDGNIAGVYDTLSENFNNFYQGQHTDISIADLNADGKVEYLLGTSRGGLVIMSEKDTITVNTMPFVAKNSLRVYPNPAQNQLVLDFEESIQGELNLTIYNTLGQVLLQKTFNNAQKQYLLDISAMPDGVLFLEAEAGGTHETVRVVKR